MEANKRFIGFSGALCFALVCLTLSVWLLFTANSLAAEAKLEVGVVEISQSDVPFVIDYPGSYRLVSNLIVSSPDVTAIINKRNNVTIDLNGFAIIGPGKNTGSGFGIQNEMTSAPDNVVVRGGTVRNFGGIGIHLHGTNNRVENVRVFNTRADGIFVGKSSVVRQCQVASCGSGVNTDDGSMVLGNTIYSIEGVGIMTSGDAGGPVGGVTVMGNNIRLCGTGVKVKGQGNRIEGNTITKCVTGIDLSDENAKQNYFGKNVLQGNDIWWSGDGDDIDGGKIDKALSNIILSIR